MKKIMFNDEYGLTQAVLDGRKTNTRRIISESVIDNANECRREYFDATFDNMSLEDMLVEGYKYMDAPCFSRYKVGEEVAVAQRYSECNRAVCLMNSKGWNNKMFVSAYLVPHRIKFTGLHVERLQDISDDDCLKEGIWGFAPDVKSPNLKWYSCDADQNEKKVRRLFSTPRAAFAFLIDKVSGKGTWESNPYVFAYAFERTK